jgi:hypothetical protein
MGLISSIDINVTEVREEDGMEMLPYSTILSIPVVYFISSTFQPLVRVDAGSCTSHDTARYTYLGPARHAFLQFASSCEPAKQGVRELTAGTMLFCPRVMGLYTIFVSIPRGMSKSLVPRQNQCRYLCNYRSLPHTRGRRGILAL